jgi:WD40 repeat protein
VKSVCFSADGETIASASVNGKIILWDFDLAHLIELGNNWIEDYLETHEP